MPRRPTLIPLVAALVAAAVIPSAAGARKPVRLSAATSHRAAAETLRRVEAVRAGKSVRTGFELSPLLKDLVLGLPKLHGSQHARARRILTRPTLGQAQPGESAYAVPEQTPYCSAHFCIHWVEQNVPPDHNDAPPLASNDGDSIPDYVQTMDRVFENVYQVENVQMGWREPLADGTRGGDVNKVDVYVKQLGDQGIFGYSTPDPGQRTTSQSAYLVMDNDFTHSEYPRYTDPLLPMQVTAAHEYNHVLQFAYDVLQDSWMFEATAVWMEDKVYDPVNDYVSYLRAWTQLTQVPLTRFNASDPSDALNVKVYGDAVWNRWLDEHYGAEAIRGAWERSRQTQPPSFAPEAYDASLASRGTTVFDAFTRFAADTAEWRSSAGAFEEGPTWPDVLRSRAPSLSPSGAAVSGHLDHASFVLLDVTPTSDARVKLVGSLPRGTAGALAMVGRQGPEDSGAVEVDLRRLPRGGASSVTLGDPKRFTRITAVLMNADMTQNGFSQVLNDWQYAKDRQPMSARVSNDFKAPTLKARVPRPGRRDVSRRSGVSVRFSEAMAGVSSRTLRLLGPGGHKVAARVSYDKRRRRARLVPKRGLARHRRYTVQILSSVVDRGANRLPAAQRTWRFTTG
ncbi:MAG TPA: Ig-like domain-containing protein [Thermoleophilaceae bacterium]